MTQLDAVFVRPAWELVVDELRGKIREGAFLPGEQLPPERQLADELGVSRTKVREALLVLVGEGLIEIIPRSTSGGPLVRPLPTPSKEEIRKELGQRRRYLSDILDCRKVLESFGASEAALNRTADHIGDMDEFMNEMEQAVEDLKVVRASEGAEGTEEELEARKAKETARFRRADSGFHRAICEAAGNDCLRELVEDLRTKLLFTKVTVAVLFGSSDDLPQDTILRETVSEHQKILEAIREKNGPGADEAMREHIDSTKDALAREI